MILKAMINSADACLSLRAAVMIVLILWLAYSVMFGLYLSEPWASLLGFLPGLVGIAVLSLAGFTRAACYLDYKMISGWGLFILMILFVPMIPVGWVGYTEAGWSAWDWKTILLYAPASGIAQELYFRSTLLPVLEKSLGRRYLGWIGSSILFSLFHAGMFKVAPIEVAISALVVTFVIGMGWGWQVQRDRTVVWAMLHHSLLQMILRLFAWM